AMDLVDAPLDGRVADLAGDAQLVAAGEEHAGRALEPGQDLLRTAVRALVDVELDQVGDPEAFERLSVSLEIAVRLVRGDGGEHQLAAIEQPGEGREDALVALLVLVTADDQQGAAISHGGAPERLRRGRARRPAPGRDGTPGSAPRPTPPASG